MSIQENLQAIKPYLHNIQFNCLVDCLKGEERTFFVEKISELKSTIENLPELYEQENAGDDAMVYVHYFFGSSDWYITEKSKDDDNLRLAFGFVVLNGDVDLAELGYIPIYELMSCGYPIEMDFYFTQRKLSEIKAKHGM